MEEVRKGNVEKILVYSFSRLGRSTTHLLKVMDELTRFGVKFYSLNENLETETPAGRMIFTVLAAVSQLERELIVERVKNGLRNARAKGKIIGRAKKRDSVLIRKLLDAGLTYRAIAKITKASHGSVHAEVVARRKEIAAQKLLDELENRDQVETKSESENSKAGSFDPTFNLE